MLAYCRDYYDTGWTEGFVRKPGLPELVESHDKQETAERITWFDGIEGGGLLCWPAVSRPSLGGAGLLG